MYKGVGFILLILANHHISVVGKDGEDEIVVIAGSLRENNDKFTI
jgi:hypothetical protein